MSSKKILHSILDSKSASYPTGSTKGDIFELFCAELILRNFNLSSDEIEEGIVDGKDDVGIDAIYILVNGVLVDEQTDLDSFKKPVKIDIFIIQMKFGSGFAEAPIEKLIANVPIVVSLDQDLVGVEKFASPDVLNKAQLYRDVFSELSSQFPAVTVHAYYCVDSDATNKKAVARSEVLAQTLEKFCIDSNADVKLLSAPELYQLARNQASITRVLPVKDTMSSNDAFVALTTLSAFREFIDEEGYPLERLFEFNVRDYEGDKVQVNSAISETIADTNGDLDFWWLNNGITIIASDVSLGGKNLTIENPLIVNGLQTSHVLHNTLQPDTADERQIMVRVIEVDGDEKRDRIIQATNSQTGIKKSSLRATDPIQRTIEDYLKTVKIYYERRKNYYRNKGFKAVEIISIDRMTQSLLACFLGRPDDARARHSNVFKDEALYSKLFNAKVPFEVYRNVAQIFFAVDRFIRVKKKSEETVFKNNLRYYIMQCLVWEVCGTQTINSGVLKGFKIDLVDDVLIESVFDKVKAIFVDLGGTDKVAKDGEMRKRLRLKWAKPKKK